MLHGGKAERKTLQDFLPTESSKATERGNKYTSKVYHIYSGDTAALISDSKLIFV